jgi:acyl carrier protein
MKRSTGAFEEIVSLLASHFPEKAPITAEMHISRDLGLDSLAAMDLLMSLEDRFDISIPLNSLPEVETVGDLVALIDATRTGAAR